jgi:hypothetical protein
MSAWMQSRDLILPARKKSTFNTESPCGRPVSSDPSLLAEQPSNTRNPRMPPAIPISL